MSTSQECNLISNLEKLEKLKSDDQWTDKDENRLLVLSTVKLLDAKKPKYLFKIFPFVLKLADDHLEMNKISGIECLQSIFNTFPLNDLKPQGLDTLIFDTLKRILFNQEPKVISALLPVLINVLTKFDSTPNDKECSPIDQVVNQILTNIELTSNINLKLAYFEHLNEFVQIMDDEVLKHTKRLLTILIQTLQEVEINYNYKLFQKALDTLLNLIILTQSMSDEYIPRIMLTLFKFQFILLTTNPSECDILNQQVDLCYQYLKQSNSEMFCSYVDIIQQNCNIAQLTKRIEMI